MAADVIMKNPKSRYFGNGLTDWHIWHDDAYWPFKPDQQLKFRTFKNQRWQTAAILKNRNNAVLMDIINSLSKLVINSKYNAKTAVYTHC